MTEEEKEARLYGKPLHLTGRVFKELIPEKHIIPSLPSTHSFRIASCHYEGTTYKTNYLHPVIVGIDPHKKKPNAAIFLTITKDDDIPAK